MRYSVHYYFGIYVFHSVSLSVSVVMSVSGPESAGSSYFIKAAEGLGPQAAWVDPPGCPGQLALKGAGGENNTKRVSTEETEEMNTTLRQH